MSIKKQIICRYQADGHVRFQLPQMLCEPELANHLQMRLQQIVGVSHIRLYLGQKKLSIRYQSNQLSLQDIAQALANIVTDMEQQGSFAAESSPKAALAIKQRLKHSVLSRWLAEKLEAAKETAQAAKIIGKISVKGPKALIKDPEKAIIDFLNDILVLYLIKIHWNRITQQWLVRPFVHRYEWLAVFYLFFLLVRSRRPK